MDMKNNKQLSYSEKQLTDNEKTHQNNLAYNKQKKRKMNHSMDIRVIRDLNNIITNIKQKYLNENDKLMLRLLLNQKDEDKENPSGDETIRTISMMGNLVKYLGKTKLEFELDKENKVKNEMSEYEVHLQKLEAQIREHVRIEQQLKLFAESLQSKLDEYDKKEKERKKKTFNQEEYEQKIKSLEEENSQLYEKCRNSEDEIKELKIKLERTSMKNKKLNSEASLVRSKASSVDKFSKLKDSFMNHKNKSSRIKSGIDYKKLTNDFRKKDRKHLKTEIEKLSEYKKNYFDRSSKELIGRKTSKEKIKENKGMLKSMLKKSSPPLPNEIRERIINKTSKRLSRDKSSFLEKKRKSSRKRERLREDSQFKTSGSKIRSKDVKRPLDRMRKKKQYEIMKSYSINSQRSNSIENGRKIKDKKRKGTSSRAKAEYTSNQNKFKGGSNYINRSFLRSGSDNKQMLKISDKLKSLKASYKV